ncbi:hypothetical protein PATSB16_27000 [Pandoraea thiooxydans]|nr:hypothetical protein PATSB16_27000 [Pandoraea thiooxydans]
MFDWPSRHFPTDRSAFVIKNETFSRNSLIGRPFTFSIIQYSQRFPRAGTVFA